MLTQLYASPHGGGEAHRLTWDLPLPASLQLAVHLALMPPPQLYALATAKLGQQKELQRGEMEQCVGQQQQQGEVEHCVELQQQQQQQQGEVDQCVELQQQRQGGVERGRAAPDMLAQPQPQPQPQPLLSHSTSPPLPYPLLPGQHVGTEQRLLLLSSLSLELSRRLDSMAGTGQGGPLPSLPPCEEGEGEGAGGPLRAGGHGLERHTQLALAYVNSQSRILERAKHEVERQVCGGGGGCLAAEMVGQSVGQSFG